MLFYLHLRCYCYLLQYITCNVTLIKSQILELKFFFFQLSLRNALSSRGNFNQLREQAIARLAKEEKEFTSTVVFSENDMFLLPNTEKLGKRNKKPPKRFTDWLLEDSYKDDLTDDMEPPPKRTRRSERNVIPLSSAVYDASALDTITKARVSLQKLPSMENYEPWCMFHCLYKCYCGGKAIKGKPFVLRNDDNEKPATNPTYAGISNTARWDIIPPRKRQYTFDRDSDTDSSSTQKKNQKASVVAQDFGLTESTSKYPDTSAARVRIFKSRHPKKTPTLIKVLQKRFSDQERKSEALLSHRIRICWEYFLVQGKLDSSARKAMQKTKQPSSPVVYDLTSIDEPNDQRDPLEATELVDNSFSEKINSESQSMIIKPSPKVHVDELNRILTDTMRHFCDIQKSGAFDLNSEASMTSHKITIVPWGQLLAAFNQGAIFIWEIRLEESDTILALTIQNEMPIVKRASFIANIKAIENDSLPLIGKMLKKSVRSDKTEHLGN